MITKLKQKYNKARKRHLFKHYGASQRVSYARPQGKLINYAAIPALGICLLWPFSLHANDDNERTFNILEHFTLGETEDEDYEFESSDDLETRLLQALLRLSEQEETWERNSTEDENPNDMEDDSAEDDTDTDNEEEENEEDADDEDSSEDNGNEEESADDGNDEDNGNGEGESEDHNDGDGGEEA